jgi:hypothetical protein
MTSEMRRELARQPFEQKIRRVGQLIRLAATLKAQRPPKPGAAASSLSLRNMAGESQRRS